MEYKRINLVDTSISEGVTLTNANCKIDRIDDGALIVQRNSLFGVLDIYNRQLSNSVIRSISYLSIEEFHDGIAIVHTRTGQGLINRSGEEILEPEYTNLKYLYKNVYRYKHNNSDYGLIKISSSGISKSAAEYREINVMDENCLVGVSIMSRYYLIDEIGRKISRDYADIKKFKNGYAQVFHKGQVGIINREGREIVEPKYDNAIVENGLIKVWWKHKWGICDLNGTMMIEPQYESIDVTANQLIKVRTFKRNNPMGVVDRYNNVILPCKYRNISVIDDNYFWVNEYGSKWSKINREGTEVDRYSGFADYMTDFEDGLAVVSIDGNKYVIDSDGKQLIKGIRLLNRNHNVFVDIVARPLSLYSNRTNNYCFDQNHNYKIYQSIKPVDDNIRIVSCDSKYGLINKHNEEIVKPQFDSIDAFVGEYAIVSLNDNYGVIDKQGNFKCLSIHKDAKMLTIQGKLIKYQVLGNDNDTVNSTGIVDVDGNEILPLIDNESVHILNDNLLIIDNVLIPTENIKIIYRGVIERQTLSNELEESLEKDFETPDSRERFFASFEHDMEVLIRNYMYSYPNDKKSFQKKLK